MNILANTQWSIGKTIIAMPWQPGQLCAIHDLSIRSPNSTAYFLTLLER